MSGIEIVAAPTAQIIWDKFIFFTFVVAQYTLEIKPESEALRGSVYIGRE
jgi:hypothetical protein